MYRYTDEDRAVIAAARKKQIVLCAIAILCLTLLLNGCYTTVSSPEPTAAMNSTEDATASEAAATTHADIPAVNDVYYSDNIRGTLPGISVFPAETGFYCSDPLRYYDISQRTYVPLCSLPGCSHSDEKCPARISDVLQLLAHDASVYAFCGTGKSLSLIRYEPQTGEKTELFSWSAEDLDSSISLNSSFYSTGRIYFSVTRITGSETQYESYYYDLSSRELVTIISGNELSFGVLEGAYNDCAIVTWISYTQVPLKIEEYLQEHPEATESEYYTYLEEFSQSHILSELRQYDLKTLEYTDFAPVLQNGDAHYPYLNFSSNGCFYGEYILYTLGDSICRYSLKTCTVEVLAQEPDAINGFLLDGRLLYLVLETDGLVLRLYDPDTGDTWDMKNGGNREIMLFAVYRETQTAFIGLYEGKNAVISKEDFYAEAYDKAVFY